MRSVYCFPPSEENEKGYNLHELSQTMASLDVSRFISSILKLILSNVTLSINFGVNTYIQFFFFLFEVSFERDLIRLVMLDGVYIVMQ